MPQWNWPPSAARASQISNDSSVPGSTVKDALNALLAGAGSLVTSVFGRTGAVVATLGDYAASKISNDSSVSGSTTKDALNYLLASNGSLPLLPRSSPNAFDDEFISGSADFATRGWTIVNAFSGAAMTRVGAVDPATDPSTLTGVQYRSSITPAGLIVQTSATAFAYKTMPAGAGSFAACAYSHRQGTQITTSAMYVVPIQLADGPIINNTSKRLFTDNFDDSFRLNFMNTPQAYTVLSTPYSAIVQPGVTMASDLYFLYWSYAAGTITYDLSLGNSQFSRRSFFVSGTHAPAGGFTPTIAGMLLSSNIAEKCAYNVVRFIRFYSAVRYVAPGVTP